MVKASRGLRKDVLENQPKPFNLSQKNASLEEVPKYRTLNTLDIKSERARVET